ncbi:6-phosphofructokinase [Gracilimonas mengyeensis]|uniref:ATP-dependent 6-phosphofructokinase n=1 Tax=Gracilimonas mengyeensis TaxID=1302730 RepID=A0A521DSI3_9BACT|nr:6-phosphofructokinase [Gracilimonas mengyeensis]SMO74669.1 6-phosphofructokinase [Gracilimonas mengyeensis]
MADDIVKIKTIGVLTSGGDSPGMNAAIRAVARAAFHSNINVIGIKHGYYGLINDEFEKLDTHSVSNIIQRGGTTLKSARSEEFRTEEGRAKAAENLKKYEIDALVTIGGDGTFTGANKLSKEHGINVVGVPATIDNDIIGTDETIGYDTALNTALDAIDKIRDTADAHERMFLVEVMGRDTGFIALETGIASGAELALLPEELTHVDEVKEQLHDMLKQQRRSSLVVVAEGDETGGAMKLADNIKDDFSQYDVRVCILGHVQRGGAPTARDRVLASRLGAAAVNVLMEGHSEVMVGVVNNALKITPLRVAISKKKALDHTLIDLARVLR